MAPASVVAGDVLEFMGADTLGFAHRFYDDFPYGRRVQAFEAYVDLHGTILVEDVRTGTFDGTTYVGVQFRAHNGMILWTTFAKNDEEFLRVT